MILSSAEKLYLMLLMISCLYHFQPIREDDNEVVTKEFSKVEKNLKDGFQAPITEDDKSEEILPLLMAQLTPAFIEIARRELNETDEIKQKALVELRRLIEAEENLISPTGDAFLLAFLRKKRFDVARAFKRVQDFWIFYSDYEHIFSNVNKDSVISFFEKNTVGLLNYRDREGCIVLISKPGMWDPDEDPLEVLIHAYAGVLTYAMENEATQVAGYRIIIDVRGIGWKQLKFLTPSMIILLIRGGMYVLPAKIKRIHVVGEAKMMRLIWNILYPFLPVELKKRVSLHGEDFESLQELIHPTILPEEYGGLAPHFVPTMELVTGNFDKITGLLDYGYKK